MKNIIRHTWMLLIALGGLLPMGCTQDFEGETLPSDPISSLEKKILLTPTGLRKFQRVFLGNGVMNFPLRIHKQQLHGRCSKVDSDIKAHYDSPFV